jgi:hypothetical protein
VPSDRDRDGILATATFSSLRRSTYVLQRACDQLLQLVQAAVNPRTALSLQHRLHDLSVLISL